MKDLHPTLLSHQSVADCYSHCVLDLHTLFVCLHFLNIHLALQLHFPQTTRECLLYRKTRLFVHPYSSLAMLLRPLKSSSQQHQQSSSDLIPTRCILSNFHILFWSACLRPVGYLDKLHSVPDPSPAERMLPTVDRQNLPDK